MRFVLMFHPDPKDPNGRLRLDWDSDFGNAILADENTLPEHVDDPDARHVVTLATMQLTRECVRWLHEATGELLAMMDAGETPT